MNISGQTDCLTSMDYDCDKSAKKSSSFSLNNLSLSEKSEVTCRSNCAAVACTVILLIAALAVLGAAAFFLATPLGLPLLYAGIVLMTIAVISAITLAIVMNKEKNQLIKQHAHEANKLSPASSYHSLPDSMNCPYCRNERENVAQSIDQFCSLSSTDSTEWDTTTCQNGDGEHIYDTPACSPIYANDPYCSPIYANINQS